MKAGRDPDLCHQSDEFIPQMIHRAPWSGVKDYQLLCARMIQKGEHHQLVKLIDCLLFGTRSAKKPNALVWVVVFTWGLFKQGY